MYHIERKELQLACGSGRCEDLKKIESFFNVVLIWGSSSGWRERVAEWRCLWLDVLSHMQTNMSGLRNGHRKEGKWW